MFESSLCKAECDDCVRLCPVRAISKKDGSISVDLGKCLFCTDCVEACRSHAIKHSSRYSLSARNRDDLILNGTDYTRLAHALDKKMLALFGRSLHLRQVSAGGCNACEADINVLTTIIYDLGRFGVKVVASPKHADGLLVTGPVTKNMVLALRKTYDVLPEPKLVIAVGACAISGGVYSGHDEVVPLESMFPVNLYIPGCPPHPITILDGLLRLLGRMPAH